jgi:hypothetical protein
MRRRSLRMSLSVLGAALIASAVAVAVTPSAAAAALPVNCPFSNTLCLFDGTNFTGATFNVSAWNPAGACVNLSSHGWGSRARSGINTHRMEARLYTSTDCTGVSATVRGNSSLPTLPTRTANSVFVAGLSAG